MVLNFAIFLGSHAHTAVTPIKNAIDEETAVQIVLLPYIVAVHRLSDAA
jgi:hypothetical protein